MANKNELKQDVTITGWISRDVRFPVSVSFPGYNLLMKQILLV